MTVRELLLGPKRFTDLRAGLPHASPNVLSSACASSSSTASSASASCPPPAASQVYELTDWGRELEPVLTRSAAGARAPRSPGPTRR